MAVESELLRMELRRIECGPQHSEEPDGLGLIRFRARCAGNAWHVLDRAKSVLKLVAEKGLGTWPSDDEWRRLLPTWFVSACAPTKTREEATAWLAWWRTLSPDEQARLARDEAWSVPDWTYWFQPGNRQWYWWDTALADEDNLLLAVEAREWPFPWGGLRWLFRAAGAHDLETV
jgi:hypothetical protein